MSLGGAASQKTHHVGTAKPRPDLRIMFAKSENDPAGKLPWSDVKLC